MADRVFITSALPYINGVKHLGNLIGSMLPADVFARFCRQRGDDVLYLCATDEHGTPAELAAKGVGIEPREYCEKQHEIQSNIYDAFDISFDYFGRSSNLSNHATTQYICEQLLEKGFILEDSTSQLYSIDDQMFLADRYVEGVCPFCGFIDARGDQCDKCSRLLNPEDLERPRSTISGSENLELRSSNHLFLDLQRLSERISIWLSEKKDWNPIVRSIADKWLNEGLQARCITRDLSWGIPVNHPDMPGKVFYVWFDAPIAYISTTKDWANSINKPEEWKKYWESSTYAKYYQFMAKDNVAFHSIMFPGMLLGASCQWRLVNEIKAFNWLNFYGDKFSTSRKHGVFLDEALEEYPADYWRYWLLANAPESSDTTFTFESFASTINSDLNGKFGNFILRVSKLAERYHGNYIPVGGQPTGQEKSLALNLSKLIVKYYENIRALEFRKATERLRDIWSVGNVYIAETEPWRVIKEDPERGSTILRTGLNLIDVFCFLALPIIPATCKIIRTHICLDPFETGDLECQDSLELILAGNEGRYFDVPDAPFSRISTEDVERLTRKYVA